MCTVFTYPTPASSFSVLSWDTIPEYPYEIYRELVSALPQESGIYLLWLARQIWEIALSGGFGTLEWSTPSDHRVILRWSNVLPSSQAIVITVH